MLFGLQPNNFFFSPIPGGGNPNDFLFPQHCEMVDIGAGIWFARWMMPADLATGYGLHSPTGIT